MPHDDKITHYIDKTLLDFVEIYFFTHYYIVSIFHYTPMFISYPLYVKIYQLRD